MLRAFLQQHKMKDPLIVMDQFVVVVCVNFPCDLRLL